MCTVRNQLLFDMFRYINAIFCSTIVAFAEHSDFFILPRNHRIYWKQFFVTKHTKITILCGDLKIQHAKFDGSTTQAGYVLRALGKSSSLSNNF